MDILWEKLSNHKKLASIIVIGGAMGYMDGVISFLERMSLDIKWILLMLDIFHIAAQFSVPILLGVLVYVVIDLKAKTQNRIFSESELQQKIKDVVRKEHEPIVEDINAIWRDHQLLQFLVKNRGKKLLNPLFGGYNIHDDGTPMVKQNLWDMDYEEARNVLVKIDPDLTDGEIKNILSYHFS